MKKLILVIGLLFAVLISFAQREVDADVVIVRDSIIMTNGKITGMNPGTANKDAVNRQQLVDSVAKYSFIQPVDSIFFDRDAVTTGHNAYKVDVDTTNGALRVYNDEVDIAMQLGQELWLKIKNNNGSTFNNGILVYISGGESGFPVVSIGHNRDFETSDIIGILTHDVEAGTFGFLTTYGTVGGLDTSGETEGATVYLDTLTAGKNWTTTIPEFANFQFEVGFIHTVDASDGKIFVNPKGQIDDIMHNINNANILENFAFTSTSNGTTITGTLESSDGKDYLTVRWSDGFAKISVPTTVTIPEGTDNDSQTSYIYIPKSTGVLTSSTSYFPIGTQYKTISRTEAWTALRTQSEGLKGIQNYNDFVASTESLRGRIAQIGNWQRLRNLKYINGSNGTVTVRTNGAAPDTVTYAVTQGNWSQANEQLLLAMDMYTGDNIHAFNYPDHADTTITDLNEILIDATGASLTGRSWTYVFWISQNKTGEPSHMYVNLPNGSYSSGAAAEADVSGFKVTEIPYEMRPYSGFVTEVVMTHTNPSGGTWVVYSTTNIQGNEPGYAGGGASGESGGTFDSDTDTPASKAGSSNKLVGVDLGEANLVYKSVTVDGSGNLNAAGTISENSIPVASSTEIIDTIFTTENVSFSSDSINYTKNGVTYNVTEVRNPDGIDQGGIVTLETGLIYNISPCKYQINGVPFESITSQETLTTADVTNPRIDIIVVDTLGVTDIVTGVAAASPQKPTANPESQIELTSILVNAGATTGEPGGGGSEAITVVYDENVEWVGGQVGTTVDFASATDPFHGTINAEVTNISNVDYITFTAPVAISSTDITNFSMYLKLKEAATKRHRLYVQLLNDGGGVTTILQLPMDYTNTGWQNLSISLEGVRFSQDSIDEVQLVWAKTPDVVFSGFYIDLVQLQGGYDQPTTIQPHTHPISDIVDLGDTITALDTGKVPYTGATGNVDLGLFDLDADSLNITNGATLGGNTSIDGDVIITGEDDGSVFRLNSNTNEQRAFQIAFGGANADTIKLQRIISDIPETFLYARRSVGFPVVIPYDLIVDEAIVSDAYGTNVQTLTETAGAVAWDMSDGSKAKVTIDETSVITITNMPEGAEATIRVTQGDAGDDNVTFVLSGATVEWRNDDQDITDTSGAHDYISVVNMDGILGVTWGENYTTQ